MTLPKKKAMGQSASQQLANRLAQAASTKPIKEIPVPDDNPTAEQIAAQRKAEIDAAVAAATAPLQAIIDAGANADAVSAAVAEAITPLQAELAAANSREAAQKERADKLEADAAAFRETLEAAEAAAKEAAAKEAAEAELKAATAARLTALTAKVEDGGLGWTVEAATPSAARYAQFSDEDWAATLADLRTAAQANAANLPPAKDSLNIVGSSVLGGTGAAAPQAGAVDQQGRPVEGNQAQNVSADAELVLANRKRIKTLHD